MNPSIRIQVLDLIRETPGIRAPELAEELDLENCPSQYIRAHINRGEVLVEEIEAETTGKKVKAFTINRLRPPETDDSGAFKARRTRQPRELPGDDTDIDVSISSRGVTSIVRGNKTMTLSPAETARLVMYFDRMNVESILVEVGAMEAQ